MRAPTDYVVGFVQAGLVGDVAWLIGIDWQRVGYARDATDAFCSG
ncbi:MAG: hypothetical protein QNM02_15300 [Acidimicrobiia bacterium]|nr:hypothetical protein [Acidimicrobiia bacterium]